ncbi:hypothetical protein CI109_104563 [Kwoniella shandongensis]|uniref:Uncharacterized protein n=1 Tax=Kwoniella shandongensis TaxID=1734106 RepID=A0A5M6BTR7_9TREE|nr:uncharacterized protein CI109_005547 [Kwoniella shandongensis]KAA5526113.1 hypothetical protein CI109_005547 [Kwoniella shandongensis]
MSEEVASSILTLTILGKKYNFRIVLDSNSHLSVQSCCADDNENDHENKTKNNSGMTKDIESITLSELTLRRPRVIHPEFSSHGDDDILLVSSNNVGFFFPLKVLITHVHFFSDFETIPQPTDGKGQTDSIDSGGVGGGARTVNRVLSLARRERRDFPSTSAGLRIVLYALWTTLHNSSIPLRIAPKLKPTETELLDGLPSALEIDDAYGIPTLVGLLVKIYADNPFLAYTIAAVASNESLAIQQSTETLALDINRQMSDSITTTLRSYAPQYLNRLQTLHRQKRDNKGNFDKLQSEFQYTWTMSDKLEDFGKNCYKHDGCVAQNRFRDFANMRRTAGKRAFARLRLADVSSYDAHDAIRSGVAEVVDCYRCSVRLANTFISAWNNYARTLVTSI